MDSNQVLYATLPRRIKAGIVDGIVVMSLFIIAPLVINSLAGEDIGINGIVMFIPPLLLEPFLISYLGFTFGQYIFGIQVVRVDTGGKCPLPASFIRYCMKIILGLFSMLYMLFSRKHQAIHDHIANTLVVLSHKRIEQRPEFAQYGETEQELEDDLSYSYPSALRRFICFCIWSFAITIPYGILIEIAALLLLPGYTPDTEKLPDHIEIATEVVLSIIYVIFAVLASKGRLLGARRKKKDLQGKTG